jgi:hypothetical protein
VARASSKIIFNISADAIWQVVGDFGSDCKYLTGVVHCTVEGEGVGALRTLTYADGAYAIVERLEMLDATARRLSYTLLTDTPFRNCLTTMTVRNLGPNQTEPAWSASFEPVGLPENEAMELLEGALAADGLALKQFVEADIWMSDRWVG